MLLICTSHAGIHATCYGGVPFWLDDLCLVELNRVLEDFDSIERASEQAGVGRCFPSSHLLLLLDDASLLVDLRHFFLLCLGHCCGACVGSLVGQDREIMQSLGSLDFSE